MTYLANFLLNINESSILQLLCPLMGAIQWLAESTRTLADVRHPELCFLGNLVGAIIREEATWPCGIDLEPGARLESVVGILEELGSVRDTAAEFAGVDVVKGLAEGPVRLKIIDLERAVGRCPTPRC